MPKLLLAAPPWSRPRTTHRPPTHRGQLAPRGRLGLRSLVGLRGRFALRSRLGLRSLVGLIGLLLIAGCSPGPTPVPVPSPAPEVAAACAELVKALPAKVLDAERRETSPKSPLTAAYGDPPIEMTCGVTPPAGMAEAQSQCFEVNGVGWFAKQVENGFIFTTIGRSLYFEVAVPAKYTPEANALTDVSDAVQKHNKLVTPCT
ncbi:uncharacterized protein DUF3515 [Kribbella pratensis]|uniref:Uncharacterized protein DUF3515 n=1 Tax=Kribbella pratensis TaxID=2512112 RepID=A0ABY2F4U2_9ACTN|nr:DUF3515 domain-containing protein [Kribbella pratensis]TDW81569.1 uncharacterized protein DUF3515 [Kribbella pratensis]